MSKERRTLDELNMLQLFKDALYLAKKHNYRINVFEFLPQSHQITRREIKSIDSEIIETENNGFDRGDREIRDWQIIRNWNQRKVGCR